jgi:hypothetical protein
MSSLPTITWLNILLLIRLTCCPPPPPHKQYTVCRLGQYDGAMIGKREESLSPSPFPAACDSWAMPWRIRSKCTMRRGTSISEGDPPFGKAIDEKLGFDEQSLRRSSPRINQMEPAHGHAGQNAANLVGARSTSLRRRSQAIASNRVNRQTKGLLKKRLQPERRAPRHSKEGCSGRGTGATAPGPV